VTAKRGRNRGWSTTPTVLVVAFSGVRFGLPPSRPLYWPAGFGVGLCPTAQPLRDAAEVGRREDGVAHGSLLPSSPTNCGANSSWMFGARTARL
jgi:hypothetical protein